jgi:hypothetical protein
VRPNYPRRRELQRSLGHHYEDCKTKNAGRFKGRRLQSYCAAVAWTIAQNDPRYRDYFRQQPKGKTPMRRRRGRTPPRNPRTGKFMRSSRHRPKSGSEARRRRSPRRYRARASTAMMPAREVRRAAAPRRRRRRARARTAYAYAPRRRRRRSSRRSGPKNIVVMGETHRRRRRGRRVRAHAPPLLTAGGVVVFCIGGLIGYEVTDLVDRYIASQSTAAPAAGTTAPALPTGVTSVAQYNDLAVAAKPSMGRIFWGLSQIVMGFGLGWAVPWSGLKLFFYGWGAAATFHLGGRLIDTWIVMPLLAPAAGQPASRLFTHETNAQALLNPSTTTTTTTTAGTTAGTMGAPRLPAGQPAARVPQALATHRAAQPVGLGAAVAPLNFSRAAYQAIAANPNPSGFVYTPEGAPVTPPANNPPPGTPPSPGGSTLPGSTPPATSSPPTTSPPNGGGMSPPMPPPPAGNPPWQQPCPPCSPTSAPPLQQTQQINPGALWNGPTPCCGATPCQCGNCGQPPSQTGQPSRDYRHPLFRSIMNSQRRAA